MTALTLCAPTALSGESVTLAMPPYAAVGPYSNHAVLGSPYGFTVPCRVVVVAVILLALPAVTPGGSMGPMLTAG